MVSTSADSSSRNLSSGHIDPKNLQHKIEKAKEAHAFVAKIATNGENKEHGELIAMLHDLSHSNLKHAEEAMKEGHYEEAFRHIDNIHKAADAAAGYTYDE